MSHIVVSHAIATSNGTTALHAALLAAGVGPGDEVIVPAFTFFATASAVSICGARPAFADVDPVTATIIPGRTHVYEQNPEIGRNLTPERPHAWSGVVDAGWRK